jgi:ABC-type sugar transport system ATPase subunit
LARALVKEPDLLLLDEPLSNLDAKLRIAMRAELKRLQKDLGITTIFVTHDQIEAMTMADRIAVLDKGRLQQVGSPEELYRYPANTFVAGFIGTPPMNLLEAYLVVQEGKPMIMAKHFGFPLPAEIIRDLPHGGERREVLFGIRPEDIRLGHGEIRGEVYVVEPLGRDVLITLKMGEEIIKVLAPADLKLQTGEIAKLSFPPEKIHLFDNETGESLLRRNPR